MYCQSLTTFRSCVSLFQVFAVLRKLLLVVVQLPALVIAFQDTLQAYGNEDLREYCQLETFSPRCRPGDVIVMTTARFGRMRVGKCIDVGSQSTLHRADPYSLGCFADVLDYADRICSGRSSCDIPVPTRELLSTRPCFEQLTMYLEAGYTCMSVVEQDRSCRISVPTTVRLNIRPPSDTSSEDDNSIQHDMFSRCGSPSHPWILQAQTGQLINISLLDFVQQRRRRSRWSDDVIETQPETAYGLDHWLENCIVRYGYIVDKAAPVTSDNTNTSICATAAFGTGLPRDRFVYQSKGSSVEIVQTDWQTTDRDRFTYLISFEAVGCGNLVPPPYAWLSRSDNEATVGCFLTRKRWRLQCVDGQWRGIIGTCVDASGPRSAEAMRAIENSLSSYQGIDELGYKGWSLSLTESDCQMNPIIVATICIAGLVSCFLIVVGGIACVRRYQRQTYTVDYI